MRGNYIEVCLGDREAVALYRVIQVINETAPNLLQVAAMTALESIAEAIRAELPGYMLALPGGDV